MNKPKPVKRIEKLSDTDRRRGQEQLNRSIIKSKTSNTDRVRSGAVNVILTEKEKR